MKCPICKQNTFLEIETSPIRFVDVEGWSIKECMNCGYKVRDRTFDERFIGIAKVLRKPDMSKVGS